MATATDGGGDTLLSMVGNAGEFVKRRLEDAESGLSPAELAEEYGCSQSHMQNTCSELAGAGEISRVGTGSYVSEPETGEEPGGDDSEQNTGSDEEADEEPAGSLSVTGEGGEATESEGGPSDRDAAIAGGVAAGGAAVPVVLEEASTKQLFALLAVALVVGWYLWGDSGSSTSTSAGSASEEIGQQPEESSPFTMGGV